MAETGYECVGVYGFEVVVVKGKVLGKVKG